MNDDIREQIQNFDLPNPFRSRTVVDFAICSGKDELTRTLHEINRSGFVFLTATQAGKEYTVFFWRHLT